MAEKFQDKKINEALDLLNELAREKKAKLQGMVSEKHSYLKSALGSFRKAAMGIGATS
jgi:hypothetical protein